jgi:hypothetical protein
VKDGVTVGEIVVVEETLPPTEPVAVWLLVPLTVREGLDVGVGVALAAASLYITPPVSTTNISLSLDSAGDPLTGFARGTFQS